jgi:hypothetical protein
MIEIKDVPVELSWTFHTRKNNIKFGIFKEEVLRKAKSFHLHDWIPDLDCVLPVSHYQSSSSTIHGSTIINSRGYYYLIFDNSFSLKTSKKLLFSVNLGSQPVVQEVSQKEVMKGWMLKKGNLAMQGYQKRWVTIESNGVLNYYKSVGGALRGQATLVNSAVHVDHDHCLIDVDTGQEIFHFKVLSSIEFQMWTSALEKFADTKQNHGSEFLHGSIVNLDQQFGIHSMDSDMHDMNATLLQVLDQLKDNIKKMKQISDSSRGRIDNKSSWKDFMNIIVSFSLTTDSLSEEVQKIQKYLVSYTSKIQNYRLQASNVFKVLESAFIAAIKDNNSIRTKFGLEEAMIHDFLPPDIDMDELGLISQTFSGINSIRKGSIASMNQYYDAESGEDEDEGSDTSSYSSSDSYNLHSAIEDYESGLSSTDDGTQSAADLADLGPMEDLNLEDSLEESLEDSMDFQSFQASAILLEEKSITRRTKLPYPTISMENINFMSILRNNVSCDYSYLF